MPTFLSSPSALKVHFWKYALANTDMTTCVTDEDIKNRVKELVEENGLGLHSFRTQQKNEFLHLLIDHFLLADTQ